jgi:DNA-binding CsgD family transcriptional regulator
MPAYLSFLLGFGMDLNNFAERLLQRGDTEVKAKAILNEYLLGFGICSYAFTYYSGHIKSGRKLKFHCVSATLRPWHLHYLEQQYADVDRTLEDSQMASLPQLWDVYEQLRLAKHKREQRIRLESIEFGIHKGLSIPVHGPNHDFVNLVLHQRQNESCLQNSDILQYEWLSATHIFYNHIVKILDLNSNAPDKLTTREKQCLAYTAKLWRVQQIAKQLKISPRTVNFHIQNANKKLGTNSKYQSVYKYF